MLALGVSHPQTPVEYFGKNEIVLRFVKGDLLFSRSGTGWRADGREK